jgi:predicted Rossmann fold nucleotide-binding protein DprA/Smf involved in DNA uptake
MAAMTPEQNRILGALAKLTARYVKAEQAVTELRAQRVALYRQARAAYPPLTYDEIAEASGITAAAVQQALFKADNPRPHGRPGRPRGSKSKV